MEHYDDKKCSLLPSRGGPPIEKVREWARALGLPTTSSKAAMCNAIAQVLQNPNSMEKTNEDGVQPQQDNWNQRFLVEPQTAIERCKDVPSRGGPSADDVRQWARSLGIDVRGQTKRQLCAAIADLLQSLQASEKVSSVKQSEPSTTTIHGKQTTSSRQSNMKRQRKDFEQSAAEQERSGEQQQAINCRSLRKNRCGSIAECEWIVGKGCKNRDDDGDDDVLDERALKRVQEVSVEVSGDPLFAQRVDQLTPEDRDAVAAMGAVLQEVNNDKTPLEPPSADKALEITTAMHVLRWYMSCTPIATVVEIANTARASQTDEEPGIAALINYFVQQGLVSVTIEGGRQGVDIEDVCPIPRFEVVAEVFDMSADGQTCPARFDGPKRSLDESSNVEELADVFKNRCCINEEVPYGSEAEHNRLQTYIARTKRMLDEFARDQRPLTRESSFYRWRREDRNDNPTEPVPLEKVTPRCLQDTCAAPSYMFGFGAPRCIGDDDKTHYCDGKQPPRLNASEQLISAEVYQDVLYSVFEANDAVNARYRSWRYGYGSLQQNVDFVFAMRSFEKALHALTHELTRAKFMTAKDGAGLQSLSVADVQRFIALFLEFRIAGFRVEHTADSIVNAPGVMTRAQEWMWSKVGKSNWRYLLGSASVIAAYYWGGWLSAAFLAYELLQRFQLFTVVSGVMSFAGASVAAYQTFASQVTDKLAGYILHGAVVDFRTWLGPILLAPTFAERRLTGICETIATYLVNLFYAIVVWPGQNLLSYAFASERVPDTHLMTGTEWFKEAVALYKDLNPGITPKYAHNWVLQNAAAGTINKLSAVASKKYCGMFTSCGEGYSDAVGKIAKITDAASLHKVASENYERLINFPAGKFWLGVAIAMLNSRIVDLRFQEDEDIKNLVKKKGVKILQVPDLFDEGRIGIQGTTFQYRPASPESSSSSRMQARRKRLQRRQNKGSTTYSAYTDLRHRQALRDLGLSGK